VTVRGCVICDKLASLDTLPASENVWLTPNWAVVHAFDTALEGWLVLLSRTHALSYADLSDEAVQELGLVQKRLTAALQAVVGAERAYIVAFSEQGAHGDYRHLHVHVIPRMPDQSPDHKGPNMFKLLGVPAERAVPQERRNELAQQLNDHLTLKETP
jgi:diadenosine tetraphosphate (Ap4A) HIT family hydrolase